MNKIQLRRSIASGDVPTAGELTTMGEPFVNINDERFFVSKWDGTFFELKNRAEASWFDMIWPWNTSTSTTETPETITLEGSAKVGISSEIIYKGTTYKRFDLNDDSESYVLTTSNQIIIKRY